MKKNSILMMVTGLLLAIISYLIWYSVEGRYGSLPHEFNPLTTISGWTAIIGIVIFIVGIALFVKVLMKEPSRDRYCPSCGREIPFDAKVCPYCKKDFEISTKHES